MTDCEEVNVAHATVKMQCHVILTIDGIRWTNSSNKFWNHIVSSAVAILAQSHIKNCLPTEFGILQESWAYPGDLAVIRRQRTPRELSLSSKSWRSCWRRRQRLPDTPAIPPKKEIRPAPPVTLPSVQSEKKRLIWQIPQLRMLTLWSRPKRTLLEFKICWVAMWLFRTWNLWELPLVGQAMHSAPKITRFFSAMRKIEAHWSI